MGILKWFRSLFPAPAGDPFSDYPPPVGNYDKERARKDRADYEAAEAVYAARLMAKESLPTKKGQASRKASTAPKGKTTNKKKTKTKKKKTTEG